MMALDYSTAFGAVIDIEIDAALRAGMAPEKIATELGQRSTALRLRFGIFRPDGSAMPCPSSRG